MQTQYKLEAKLAGNYIKAYFYLKKLNKEFILINFCLILVENFKYKLWSQYRTCPQHLFLAAMADMPLKTWNYALKVLCLVSLKNNSTVLSIPQKSLPTCGPNTTF
jgi:hypothetical protein